MYLENLVLSVLFTEIHTKFACMFGKQSQNWSKAQPELCYAQAVYCVMKGVKLCASVLGLVSKSPHLQSSTSGSVDWSGNPAFLILNEYTFNPFVHWTVISRALWKAVIWAFLHTMYIS